MEQYQLFSTQSVRVLCWSSSSQADVVFWLGDLNYRITEEIPDQEVFDMLRKDDLENLRRVIVHSVVVPDGNETRHALVDIETSKLPPRVNP